MATFGVAILLMFVGGVLLGVAVWRSGVLPRWAGALWVAGAVFMYPLGLVYAATIGPQSTPPTVLVGAMLLVISGGWIVLGVLRRSLAEKVGVAAQSRVH